MQSSGWAPEHCDALRQYLANGMSYSEIADAINAKFNTAYSRNAAIGRARRMGLSGPDRPDGPDRATDSLEHWPCRPRRKRHGFINRARAPCCRNSCGRCRLSSGGDRQSFAASKSCRAISRWSISNPPIAAILMAAMRRARPSPFAVIRGAGSSYCAPHFHLTRGPGTLQRAGTVSLRLWRRHESRCRAAIASRICAR